MYRIILPLYFSCFLPPSPSAMPEAAAVALATLQNKLVAFRPSVPNLGYVEVVCFLFLFITYQKPDFIIQMLTFLNSYVRANFSRPSQS